MVDLNKIKDELGRLITHKKNNPSSYSSKPDSEVLNFIKTNLQNGYEVKYIKNHLLSVGFSKEVINGNLILALNDYAKNKSNSSLNIKNILKIGIPTIIIILAIFFIIMIFLNTSPSINLLMISEIQDKSLYAGENMHLNVKILNENSKKDITANLIYEIVGTEIYSLQEIDLATQKNNMIDILIPEYLKPGKYDLKVSLVNKDLSTFNIIHIYINPSKTATDDIKKIKDGSEEVNNTTTNNDNTINDKNNSLFEGVEQEKVTLNNEFNNSNTSAININGNNNDSYYDLNDSLVNDLIKQEILLDEQYSAEDNSTN